MPRIHRLAVAALALLLNAAPAAAQQPGPMVPGLLRVCADPDNMPFSNEAQEGFENRLATLIASAWNSQVQYLWWAAPRGLFSKALNGRYWGRIADIPFLHFELCYYQAIDLAIEMGLPRVEAGAQGEHKLARGYLPAQTYSAHWIAHPGLRDAVDRYLKAETPAITEEAEVLAGHAPFRKDANE